MLDLTETDAEHKKKKNCGVFEPKFMIFIHQIPDTKTLKQSVCRFVLKRHTAAWIKHHLQTRKNSNKPNANPLGLLRYEGRDKTHILHPNNTSF